ncbi:MFS transporter [Deinococcus aquaedulcis]|uniref:MFS transporter n=1 Tax=Deinococcus aquaedulcis TaxID=2840455 RepID=UPI001C83301D|nr:MFS transporter [Deinococcus aquaedulcis]
MRFRHHAPSPPLRDHVQGYWELEDLHLAWPEQNYNLPERTLRLMFSADRILLGSSADTLRPMPPVVLTPFTVQPERAVGQGRLRALVAELYPWGARQLLGWHAALAPDALDDTLSASPWGREVVALVAQGEWTAAREALDAQLLALAAQLALPFSLMQVALPILARDSLHWGPAQVGTVLMVSGLCDIVAQGLLLPHLVRALGEGRLARAGLGLGIGGMVGLALLPLHPAALLVYLSVALLALGEGVYTACMTTLISLATPAHEQGRVQGGAQAVGELAQAAGPLISGQLYARLGPAATFGTGAAAVALALGVLLATPRTAPNRPEPAAT